MNAAVVAAISAFGGAIVAASASVVVSFSQRLSSLRNEHRLRAFEKHLSHYERIFVTARSAQDSLHDYAAIDGKVTDRSDPFLRQLLSILSTAAHDFNTAVDWRHNSGMLYLDVKLENLCLHARDLLIAWLSVQRVFTGDIAFVRLFDKVRQIPVVEIAELEIGDYHELLIESRLVVLADPGDQRLAAQIDKALTRVILELKDVLAY
jgi:hypothetical protein